MTIKNYYIKNNYKVTNKINMTYDDNRDTQYWFEKQRSSQVFQWQVYEYASRFCNSNTRVVDVGCGTAFKLVNIIGKITGNIVGIDQLSPIESCNMNYTIGSFYADNFENPSLDYKEFVTNPDIIICSDVIEHIVDPDILLNFIKLLATSSTRIIISTPNRDRLRGTECTESLKPEHVREWNFEEFSCYLQNSNFKIFNHFHQSPLKFNPQSSKLYLRILFKQMFGMNGQCFKYNQIVDCKVIN